MAFITTVILCVRSQNSCVTHGAWGSLFVICRIRMLLAEHSTHSPSQNLGAKERLVTRLIKLPRCGVASSKTRWREHPASLLLTRLKWLASTDIGQLIGNEGADPNSDGILSSWYKLVIHKYARKNGIQLAYFKNFFVCTRLNGISSLISAEIAVSTMKCKTAVRISKILPLEQLAIYPKLD